MINRLDHVNIRTARLESMIDFYTRVLGLRLGERPAFAFPGAWLYCGGHAAVHLVAVDRELDTRDPRIEHLAFQGDDKQRFVAHLEEQGVDYRISEVRDFGVTQVHVHDCDGNHIHIDFHATAGGRSTGR
jgi:catechol 2,3-dioxygenase-like lactoylglutathione lyase family enzyme